MSEPRSRRRRGLLLAGALAVIGVASAVPLLAVGSRAHGKQPIEFNHKLHATPDTDCTYCHEGADRERHASLPTLETCMGCHSDALGDNPEERKVREYADKKEEIPWKRMNRLPGHVYFSHRAHVKFGKQECTTCHGDMREKTTPVEVSQIENLNMDRCLSCHEEKSARNDCVTCHR